jgi:hypothetical protein
MYHLCTATKDNGEGATNSSGGSEARGRRRRLKTVPDGAARRACTNDALEKRTEAEVAVSDASRPPVTTGPVLGRKGARNYFYFLL